MIYLISGKARHGKDTAAEILKDALKGRKVLVIHYADYVKFCAKEYLGWNGEKDEAGRSLLQWFGTDLVRKNNPSFWVDVVAGLIKGLGNTVDDYIIPDVRFPNEADTMRMRQNMTGRKVVTINIVRVNEDGTPYDNGLTEEQKRHPSETALDDYQFDYVIRAKSGDMKTIEWSMYNLAH